MKTHLMCESCRHPDTEVEINMGRQTGYKLYFTCEKCGYVNVVHISPA